MDSQFGIFVKKHAQAVALSNKVSVIYLCKDVNRIGEAKFTNETHTNLSEQIIYYNHSGNKISLYFYLQKLYGQAITNAETNFGKCNLIQINVTGNCAIALKNKALRNTPYVCLEHGSYHFNYKLLPLHIRLLTLNTLKKANAIIAVSQYLKSGLAKKFDAKKIKIIPNVVESTKLITNENSQKIKILSVGDLVDSIKNFSGLIKAFQKINSLNVSLEIIGDGESRNELENLAGDSLNKSIFFLGKQANDFVLQKLNTCSFFVLNSNIETFCITALEAIGAGKPVIVTKCGGPEEYMSKDFGILIEKNNEADLVNALNEMIVSYKKYDTEKMKTFVQENYSFGKVGKMLDEVYDEVMENKL